MSESKLHRILKKMKINQQDLANRTGLTKGNISLIINNRQDMYVKRTLYKLCRALKVTPNDILDYEEHVKPKKK